jgi:hypothetical protein
VHSHRRLLGTACIALGAARFRGRERPRHLLVFPPGAEGKIVPRALSGSGKRSGRQLLGRIGIFTMPPDGSYAAARRAPTHRQDLLSMPIVCETTPSKIAEFAASARAGARPMTTIISNALTYPHAIAAGP